MNKNRGCLQACSSAYLRPYHTCFQLVRAKCMRTNIVRELADVVATKLGIILSSSMHILFSQKGFTYDFEFLHAFLSNKKNKI